MTNSTLILGSTGRFGAAAATAFRSAGWRVTEWRRPGGSPGPGLIHGDIFNKATLADAAEVDVIVNALNPPYPEWRRTVPRFTEAVIGAARTTGATVLIPGNVYNYGSSLPPHLTAETPHVADHRKAAIRIEMERAYAEAGIKTIILRAGDFIDTAPGDNWFEGQITKDCAKGKALYPGPLDQIHEWAFLPDLARAAEMLASRRDALQSFTDVGFPGYALTGAELLDLIDAAMGRRMKRGGVPWPFLKLIGFVSPLMREVAEMRYLWERPHQIDGSDFARLLPDFRATEPAAAIRASLVATCSLKAASSATEPTLTEHIA